MAVAMADHTAHQVMRLEEIPPVITAELIELLMKPLVELLSIRPRREETASKPLLIAI
jgi:hypothetical protein